MSGKHNSIVITIRQTVILDHFLKKYIYRSGSFKVESIRFYIVPILERKRRYFKCKKDAILNLTKHSFIQECENERGSGNAIKITYSFDARSSFKKNSQMMNKMRIKIFRISIYI